MANVSAVSLTAPSDYGADLKAIERRRQYAQLLQQQSLQPTEAGQMVSGIYVKNSPLNALAKAVQGYSSQKMQKDADVEEKELGRRARAVRAQDWAAALQARDGTPAQTQPFDMASVGQDMPEDRISIDGEPQGPAFPSIPGLHTVTAPAVPGGGKAAMYARLIQSQDPTFEQLGYAGSLKEDELKAGKPGDVLYDSSGKVRATLPMQTKWSVTERFNEATGRQEKILVDLNDPTKTRPFGGQQATKKEVGPAGQVYDPYAIQPGQVMADPNRPFSVNPQGGVTPNTPFQNYELDKAAKGATKVNTSVNTEKSFLGHVATKTGDQVAAMPDMARAAVGTIQSVNRVREAIDSGKVTTGPGTNARVFIGQVGQVLGIAGEDATEQLTKTRAAIQGMAQLELDGAQQMKGQGQITEAEREIIRRAASGDVERMSVPEIRTLMNTLDKTARYKIRQNAENVKRLGSNPNAATIVPFMQVEEPPEYKPPAPGGQSGWSIRPVR